MDILYEDLYEFENFSVDLLENYHYCAEGIIYDVANEYVKNQSVLTESSVVSVIKSVIDRIINFIRTQTSKLFGITKKTYSKADQYSKKAHKECKDKIKYKEQEDSNSESVGTPKKIQYIGFNFMGLFDKFEEIKDIFNDSIESCKDYTSDVDNIIFSLIFKRDDSDNIDEKINRSFEINKNKIQSSIKNTFGIDSLEQKNSRTAIRDFISGDDSTYNSDTKKADEDFYKLSNLSKQVKSFFTEKIKSDIEKEISTLKNISNKISREGLYDYQKTVVDDKGNDISKYHANATDKIVAMLKNVQTMMNNVISFSSTVSSVLFTAIINGQNKLLNMMSAPEAFPVN